MKLHSPAWHQSKAVRSGDDLAFGERAADKLKRSFGSWAFLITLNVFIVAWVAMNTITHRPFDPYPFIFLNLFLSWLAAQQGGALQIAANRGDRIASEVALHTEKAIDELVILNQGQLKILTRLDALQETLSEDGNVAHGHD